MNTEINTMLLLKGKRALVCGSTQGIGKAIAAHFADLGAEVILLARDPAALESLSQRLCSSANQQHAYLVADFFFPDQLEKLLADRLPEFAPINILVNNTGGPPGGLIHEARTSEFLEAFSKHLICNQILVQAVVDDMKRQGFGRIINIISTSVKQPIAGLGVANTVRGAVASWSKTLASELAPFGITVNNILPGATDTARLKSIIDAKAQKLNQPAAEIAEEMRAAIPMGRFARPEEIANVAGFLASELASYVTGINLPVDGGRITSI